MGVEIWPQLGVHLLQAVLVSLSVRFFPVYLADVEVHAEVISQ